MRCSQCHTTSKGGEHKTGAISMGFTALSQVNPPLGCAGPNLHGLFGRETGAAVGFNYSEANKNRGIVWNEKRLDKYLIHPRSYIPGTTMVFQGVKNEAARTDLIEYLKEVTTQD